MESLRRSSPQYMVQLMGEESQAAVAKPFLCARRWSEHFPCTHSFNLTATRGEVPSSLLVDEPEAKHDKVVCLG